MRVRLAKGENGETIVDHRRNDEKYVDSENTNKSSSGVGV